ncbi:uncharacterized protein (TIGR02594 family) [Sinorhizobium meliloti]
MKNVSRRVRASESEYVRGEVLPLGTIYTKLIDTFESLSRETGLNPDHLRYLNPHIRDLEELEPGIPLDIPYNQRTAFTKNATRSRGLAAYDVAKREKSLGVSENATPGQDNPRIRLYHATTHGGAMPDEVSWCSSFVNYCAEQAGGIGTESKAARSWLDWGRLVERNDWREGDIVVFWREAPNSWKGHVGFLVNWDGDRPFVLGGNQGNRICVDDSYPFSQILSVRRA